MDQRFTFKDFFLFCGMGLIFIAVLLTLYQIDRQWNKMAKTQAIMDEQAKDLRALKGLIQSINQRTKSGILVTGDSSLRDVASSQIPVAFQQAHLSRQLPEFAEGGWLVQAFSVNLKSITPFVAEDAYASEIQGYILESLITRNPETLDWEGLLAHNWQISEDGLTFSFQMREQATFSDGQPVTAEDVAFTFEFLMNNAIHAPRERAYYNKIESVTASANHKVIFKFKEPYYNALSLAGGMPVLPAHFYRPFLKNPNQFNQSKGLLLGSGPYRLANPKTWKPDKGRVEIFRNPRYWGPVQPNLNRLVWKVIENDSARLTTFRNGEIDIYSARPREYQKLVKDPAIDKQANYFEYMSPVAGYSYIGWNQSRKDKSTRFADKRVRQAMTFLLDRQRVIDEIFLGLGEPAAGPFNPGSKQHDPDLLPRPYNPSKARELLKEAGYQDRDGDGVLDDKDGQPFKFGLVYFQGSEDTKRMVLFLKDLYARAGILLEPKPTEWSVMLDLLKKRDFDAMTLGWTSGIESDLYQIFHSSQISDGGNNNISYKSEQLDQLIEKARSTVDEEDRMPLWRQAEAILYEDQPYTFLMRRKSLTFANRRIHNLKKTRLGINLGAVPVEVFIPSKNQKYSR